MQEAQNIGVKPKGEQTKIKKTVVYKSNNLLSNSR